MMNKTATSVTSRAIELAGGTARVVERCGRTKSAVNQWRAKPLPPEHCLTIEAMIRERYSAGEINEIIDRYDLRPDIYGPRHNVPSWSGPNASTIARVA